MKARTNPDDLPGEPGDYVCGDLLVRSDVPHGETYWSGDRLPDGTVRVIRSCFCGGWFAADPLAFRAAPPSRRNVPRPTNLCSDESTG